MRNGFNDEYTRKYRTFGKMAGKPRFAIGNIFNTDSGFLALHFLNAIYQQKRVSMRQKIKDFLKNSDIAKVLESKGGDVFETFNEYLQIFDQEIEAFMDLSTVNEVKIVQNQNYFP